MGSLFLLFVVAIANVFVLAFQSRNINSGEYLYAAMGSIGIGMSQAFVWKHVVANGTVEAIVYSLGGGIGCVSAMYVHRRIFSRKEAHG